MAKVNFKRIESKTEIDTIPVTDGNFIVTGDGTIYVDYGENRIEISGGAGTASGFIGEVVFAANTDENDSNLSDFILCDGREISRATYFDLFKAIGTTYGSGDGSTTFNVPDMRGRVPIGIDSNDTDINSLGTVFGEKTHTLTTNEIPSHKHDDIEVGGNHLTAWNSKSASTAIISLESLSSTNGVANQNYFGTGHTGGGKAHNNMQPSMVGRFYIRAFRSSQVVATVKNEKTTSAINTYSCDYINNEIYNKLAQGFKMYIDNDSITINPTTDVYAMVEASWGIWGFAGAEISLNLSLPDGATLISGGATRTNGHDEEAVPVSVVGHYLLPANGTYTFTAINSVGASGGVKGTYIKAITIPKIET